MFGGWGETEASVPPPLAPKGGLGGGWRVEEDTGIPTVGGGGSENCKGDNGLHGTSKSGLSLIRLLYYKLIMTFYLTLHYSPQVGVGS